MRKYLILFLFLFIPFIVNAKSNYLYDVIKDEAESNGYAKEYTGEHHDSFTQEPNYKIYHWYSNGSATTISNKYNVIFAGFCWQMIRTTDTGGVKLLYNGIPTDNTCNNTGHNADIGTSSFNSDGYILNSTGYMKNNFSYYQNSSNYVSTTVVNSSQLTVNIWYADSVTWDSTTRRWSLVNPYKVTSTEEFSNLEGKYTFGSTSDAPTINDVRYISKVVNDTYYFVRLTNGTTLDSYNYYIIYGDGYFANGDGTYSINSGTVIEPYDYYNEYRNILNKFICLNNTSENKCSEVLYPIKTTSTEMRSIKPTNVYKYANSFTYNPDTGMYTLSDDSVTFWNTADNDNVTSINNHHYTCLNESGECSSIKYVFSVVNPNYGANINYITLTNGKSVEDALNDMLLTDDINVSNSTAKTKIDTWYQNNMTNYTQYLEDTIYCNGRTPSNLEESGWNPNGGSVKTMLKFSGGEGLLCNNVINQFSIENEKAKLTYPVGLITIPEIRLSNSSYLYLTGVNTWTMSPIMYRYEGSGIEGTLIGGMSDNYTSYNIQNTASIRYGVRPVVSLKPKMRYVSGTGSKNDPFIIDYNDYYSVDIEIKNETSDLNINIEDLTSVAEGKEVTFKITPIKGFKVTNIEIKDSDNNDVEFEETANKNEYKFIMPAKDVTIIPSYERVSNTVNTDNNDHTKEIKIDVNDASAVVYEDVVIFRIDPEEGYELIDIEITDEDGNEVEYRKTDNENEYSFVMPDVDVTIKPIYKKLDVPDNNQNNIPNNPKTGASLISLMVLMIIFGISIIFVKRKSKLIRD